MVHVPILRAGRPYRSLTTVRLSHFQTGEPVAEVSQANTGLIAKDFAQAAQNKRVLESFSTSDLIAICKKAGKLFTSSSLPLSGKDEQTPEDYVHQTSATTGMPVSLCRKNMAKVFLVLDNMPAVLQGLTRGLDLSILDQGFGTQNRTIISYLCQTQSLGAILPNNSPGVHTLWLPAIPLKVPVTLKPGREEPWTPYRIAQAFLAAGCPPEAFGFYPSDYSGSTEILMRCDRLMLFGDESTVAKWQTDRRIQIHGPGRSKILIAQDQMERWQDFLDVILTSIIENAGRSCVNASGVWVPFHGKQVAETLAKHLAAIQALPMNHPDAQLAAFVNPEVAKRISQLIDQHLKTPGAIDLTAEIRKSERFVIQDGCAFLLPTVIWCTDPHHPLANTEFLFPFISVVEVSQEQIVQQMGSTLVLTAITEDQNLIQQILNSRNIDRLNIGPVPTNQVSWYQPHEGNLFELLYRQRALQTA